MFKKLITRIKQVKYYAAVGLGCAASIIAYQTSKNFEVKNPYTHIRCFVGDTGTGNETQWAVTNKMVEEGCHEGEIYILGDVIYETGIKSTEDSSLESRFLDHYGKFNKIIVALGNHDYYGKPGVWKEVSKLYKNVIHPKEYFLYKSGFWCVAVLDTEPIQYRDSKRRKAQAKWINELDLDQCSIKIAIGHHPLFSSGDHGSAQGPVKEFLEDNVFGRFHFYIAGHDHHLEEYPIEFKGTTQIVSGSGGKLRECVNKHDRCWEKNGFVKFEKDQYNFVFVDD